MLGHMCPKPKPYPICYRLLSDLVSSITFSLSSPFFSICKRRDDFCLPKQEICSDSVEKGPFSSGEERAAKCLGDAPEMLTQLLKNGSSLPVTLHGSEQEGCPFQRRDIDRKEPSHHHPLARGHCRTSPPLSPIHLFGSVEILQIAAEQLNYSS